MEERDGYGRRKVRKDFGGRKCLGSLIGRRVRPGQGVRMWALLSLCLLSALLLCACGSSDGLTKEDYARADAYRKQSASETYGPVKKEGGGKYRIGYLDIDPYPPSGEMLYYLIRSLHDAGWITLSEELPFDPGDTDAKELIRYLSERDLGEYMEFPMDACYYLAVDGEETVKESLKTHREAGDIDLLLCMGTWPGQFVKDMGITEIPVMVYFCVDPVGAGLSETSQFSGQDNIWCHVNYTVYNNQLKFYHDSFGFQNIGVVYYDESVAAMLAYREVAEEEGFTITEVVTDKLAEADEKSVKRYHDGLKETFEELAGRGIDAFMLGTDIIKDGERIQELLSVFYEKQIPVFVQNGEYFVEQGALMMVTASNAEDQAPFVADTCSAILHGKKPGELPQEYLSPPYLCLNLNAAKKLEAEGNTAGGFGLSEDLLLSAERIYYKEGEEDQ